MFFRIFYLSPEPENKLYFCFVIAEPLTFMTNPGFVTKTITKIILAEDDVDDQNIFQLALQEIHPAILLSFASNGQELLTTLQTSIPDLVFLDLDMPYKNGLECLLEIRRNLNLKYLPVIVFSSTTKPSNIQTAYEMGAHLFFIKPGTYTEYLSSLTDILKMNWNYPLQIREQHCSKGRFIAFS